MPYIDKEKQRESQSIWFQNVVKKRREEWILNNGPCKNCGAIHNLEVHHVNPETKIDHRIWTWSQARRDLELSKCIVLCSTCHGITRRKIEHGSHSMYVHRGCRCLACKSAHANTNAKYRTN